MASTSFNNNNNEGLSTTRPPLFNGTNYSYWKNKMRIWIRAQDVRIWKLLLFLQVLVTRQLGLLIQTGDTRPDHLFATGRKLGESTIKHFFDNIWRGLAPQGWKCWLGLQSMEEETNRFAIGSYLMDAEEEIKAWMGEEAKGRSLGEASIEGLESVVQFLLEDLNGSFENVILVTNKMDIVSWINNGQETCWDNRFLRNKSIYKKHVFEDVQVIYRCDRDFKAKEHWESLARVHEGRYGFKV
ncbi:hypothetical protein PIB30_014315 [Stylosanthes scabra]|uniref:DUF4219 domain-containing protein n=1 Tax=Stylosanthes scabra TaxID=79078 RepID=A0ABU6Q7N2_9FABA|nr:hypothetical protein [Stylosanthes scabra]